MSAEKRNKQKAQRTRAAEGRAKALELRKAGASYHEISETLGVPLSTVGRWVKEGIVRWQKQTEQDAGEIVTLETNRLDRMLMGFWSRAKAGDDAAVDRVLRIMERRAKLLGLDAPSKIAPTSPDGTVPYDGAGLSALLAAADKRRDSES